MLDMENFMEYQKKKRTNIRMMSEITLYLKQHHLYFKTDQLEGTPRITMVFQNCDRCPDNITEDVSGSMKIQWRFEFTIQNQVLRFVKNQRRYTNCADY